MAAESDWGRAAETLGLTVTRRKLLSRDPKKLVGQIGPYNISVKWSYATEGSKENTRLSVRFPPGQWDNHQINVTRRLKPRKQDSLHSTEVLTGDSAFDQRLSVRLSGSFAGGTVLKRTKRDQATREWVSLFLTADRRRALLDLDQHATVGLWVGRDQVGHRMGASRGDGRRGRAGLTASTNTYADSAWILQRVRPMIACGEELIKSY
jgi:hypothetical protein